MLFIHKKVVGLAVAFGLMPFMAAWIQHMFITGLNPFVGSILILIYIVILILCALFLFKHSHTRFNKIENAFLTSCIGLIIFWVLLTSTLPSIVANRYLTLISLALLLLFAGIYFIIRKRTRLLLNHRLSMLHFVITYIDLCIIILSTLKQNVRHNIPTRIYMSTNPIKIPGTMPVHSISIVLFFCAQLVLIINICATLYKSMIKAD